MKDAAKLRDALERARLFLAMDRRPSRSRDALLRIIDEALAPPPRAAERPRAGEARACLHGVPFEQGCSLCAELLGRRPAA